MIDHKKVAKHWTRNHFLLYLYLCAIEADDVLEESEVDDLLDQYETMNIGDENYVKTFNDVLIEYKAHDEKEVIEFIHQYIPEFFADPENAKKLIDTLDKLSLSDGNLNPEESDIIKLVSRLVGR
ncbi:hypothetical protein HZR84_08575 [Hyphobacterium sp. CCMP332]|nr:hypothetical protein HZR84_08575 [Hyphobacterium sp. CCMP332]